MTRCPEPARGLGVAEVAQLGLRQARAGGVHDLGAESLDAEARVRIRLGAAKAVSDVQRGDAVPELAQREDETGRVGPAGDEAEHLTAGSISS